MFDHPYRRALVLFSLLVRRYLIRGLTAGATKG